MASLWDGYQIGSHMKRVWGELIKLDQTVTERSDQKEAKNLGFGHFGLQSEHRLAAMEQV